MSPLPLSPLSLPLVSCLLSSHWPSALLSMYPWELLYLPLQDTLPFSPLISQVFLLFWGCWACLLWSSCQYHSPPPHPAAWPPSWGQDCRLKCSTVAAGRKCPGCWQRLESGPDCLLEMNPSGTATEGQSNKVRCIEIMNITVIHKSVQTIKGQVTLTSLWSWEMFGLMIKTEQCTRKRKMKKNLQDINYNRISKICGIRWKCVRL